tara:strand:+ start:361 stop:861 length:501 start_codon:yes stop_codon:yes gene_type:complete
MDKAMLGEIEMDNRRKEKDALTKIQEYFDSKIDKRMLNNDSKFDIDLQYGQIYEKALALILQDKTIEVKTERDTWKKTGNIAIELHNHHSKKPSGLSITKADYWATILVDNFKLYGIHILPVDYLKRRVKDIVRNGNGKIVLGGDYGCSEMALIPIKEIFCYAPNN